MRGIHIKGDMVECGDCALAEDSLCNRVMLKGGGCLHGRTLPGAKSAKPSKWHNTPCDYDGKHFDSLKECERYKVLRLLEQGGLIECLKVHPVYPFSLNGVKICSYEADFYYLDKEGNAVIEDVKGCLTQEYKLKRNLMLAFYGVTICEVYGK